MNTHTFFNRHLIIAIVSVPILGWVSLHTPVFKQNSYQNKQFHYTPQFFKLITAGYWPAAVEGMWISLLQGNGDAAEFYDLATDLDPYFYELYEQAGIHFSFFKEDGVNAVHFLGKGISNFENRVKPMPEKFQKRFWNHPYTLYIFQAYTYGFVLNDWPNCKAYFLKAAEIEGAPSYLQAMKGWLKEKGSEKALGERILNLLVKNTEDPEKKKIFEQKLAKLKGAT